VFNSIETLSGLVTADTQTIEYQTAAADNRCEYLSFSTCIRKRKKFLDLAKMHDSCVNYSMQIQA
jgi:hypothetical protein